MNFTCQYAVARFLPYVETEEFANFGVVLHCPENGFFGFKLLSRHVARITGFFGELDSTVYRRARDTLQSELERIREWIGQTSAKVGERESDLFAELIRPRDSMVRFGERRVVITDDPGAEVDRLFGFYVKRNFATPEYKDLIANKAVSRILRKAGIEKAFARETIEAGGYHAAFPFVRRDEARIRQIIKPLYLAYDDGARIFDHSWQWVGRIHRLQDLQFRPDQILVPVKGPRKGHNELYAQFLAAKQELVSVHATVVPIEDENAVRQAVLSKFSASEGAEPRLF